MTDPIWGLLIGAFVVLIGAVKDVALLLIRAHYRWKNGRDG